MRPGTNQQEHTPRLRRRPDERRAPAGHERDAAHHRTGERASDTHGGNVGHLVHPLRAGQTSDPRDARAGRELRHHPAAMQTKHVQSVRGIVPGGTVTSILKRSLWNTSRLKMKIPMEM